MEKILELYKKLLKVCHSVVDENGLISVELIDDVSIKSKPVTIEGKRLALPTYENMKNNNTGELVLFHPLNENIVKTTESPVLGRYRKNVKAILNQSIMITISSLLKLASSVSDHKKLSADQGELLLLLKNVNEKTFKVFEDIYTKGDKEVEFIHLFTKSNGKINDIVYPRICVVSFPFYEELVKAEKTYNGIKITNKEKEALIEVFKFIFINVEKEGFYNRGPVGTIAPTLGALMQSIKVLASELNSTIDNYKDYIVHADKILVNGDWVEDMENIDSLQHLVYSIPMQSGNNGEVSKSTTQQPQANSGRGSFVNNQVNNNNLENMSRVDRLMARYGNGNNMNNYQNQQQHGTASAVPSWKRQPQQYNTQYPQQNNGYQQNVGYTNPYQQPVNNQYSNNNNPNSGFGNVPFGYMNNYNL